MATTVVPEMIENDISQIQNDRFNNSIKHSKRDGRRQKDPVDKKVSGMVGSPTSMHF
jgi:hypothetical protein